MPTFSTHRAYAVISVIVVLFVALIGRVAYLQTYGREQTILRADRQHQQNTVLYARRGDIYDRNGMLMACTVQTKTLFIDPKFMQDSFQEDGKSLNDMDLAVQKLAHLLDMKPDKLSDLLGDRAESRFVKVAENLDEETAAAIEKLDLPGVGVTPANERYYPMGSLAAHVLGGVGGDGSGLEGLELKYDKLLAGRNGFERITKDARRRAIAVAAEDYVPPEHGQHLVLTIDANIQMIAEQELAASCEHFKAKRAEVLVIQPKTGNVLALANWPTFNPQTLEEADPRVRTDSALVVPYEPGSAFKPFILGPALMWHITHPSEVWHIPGRVYHAPSGRNVTDVEYYGNLCTWDGLVKSSNIVMSMLGERMGNPKLYAAITSFGFGRPTGIDLPGESGGKVYPLSRWSHKSTESVSQGYEVLVTPMQLARAFCAVANGGRLVEPRIVQGTVDPTGNVVTRHPLPPFDSLPRVLTPQVTAQLRRILCDVVIRGTAHGNRSKIWNIAGKTGTSHIAENGHYVETKLNSSFIACAPVEDPQLVVVYIVHEPDKSIGHYGGTVAAPGACSLIERALTYMEVPSSPPLPLPPPDVQPVLVQYHPEIYTNRSFGAPKDQTTADAGH